jgi:hypothetical protein
MPDARQTIAGRGSFVGARDRRPDRQPHGFAGREIHDLTVFVPAQETIGYQRHAGNRTGQ